MERVGVRDLRQNLSRYLERVKAGEAFIVSERGQEVGRLVPSGPVADAYVALAQRLGATVPLRRLEDVAAQLRTRSARAGTTDAFLAETRRERA